MTQKILDRGGGVLPPVAPGDEEAESAFDLWKQFAEANTPHKFSQAWLSLQCSMLPGVRSALVLMGDSEKGPFTPWAVWPDRALSVKHLVPAAERSLRERRGRLFPNGSTPLPDTPFLDYPQISYPLEVSGKIRGTVVLEFNRLPEGQLQELMRRLHWGAAWLEILLRRTDAQRSADQIGRLKLVMDLLVSAVEQERFQPAAMALVTQMATKLECDRVSLGFKDGQKLRIKALSHSAEFGKQMNLMRAIASAMDEALDQKATVLYPAPEDSPPLVTRAHAELVRVHGAGNVLTVPIQSEGAVLGGLTFERPADQPIDPQTVELCKSVASLAGPMLNAKRREERSLFVKGTESVITQLRNFIAPGHLTLKLCTMAVLVVVAFFYFARGEFRLTTQVSLEGTVQRAISAPFNGYIAETRVRPGDVVKEGQLLCVIDDRDLKLERLKWSTQREQLLNQYNDAMAKHDRSQVRINRAKIDQAEAQISLYDEQLGRTRVAAPFNGVIMKGDLSQSLGSPVERGQVLFEAAPLDSYRIIVQVDEWDMDYIKAGQRGKFMLPSMPGEVFPIYVDKITPVTVAKEGRNYFRVEARLENTSPRLRPGMEGVGKVTIGEQRFIWIWTRELIDWLYLKIWRWWPY